MTRHADGIACGGFLPRVLAILILSAALGLTACGGDGSSNRAPSAAFTATPSSGQAPLSVSFDASASSDRDGSISSYSWNFGDGTAPGSGVIVNHLYQSAGTFTATLTVTDNRGSTASVSRQVTVTQIIVPNVVGQTQQAAVMVVAGAGLTVGTVTAEPSATVAAGTVISQDPVGGTLTAPNSVVDLVVSSGTGVTNLPPVAFFTATPSGGDAPLTVQLDASASSDSDGLITSYSWDFGDNTAPGSGVTVNHLYQAAGTFTATLTVTDNRGASVSTTRVVTVTVRPPPGSVTVSGRILFERVPFLPYPQDGLNYPGTFTAPAREIEIELLQAVTGAVLATSMTDIDGNYALAAPPNIDVRVRAKALSRRTGTTTRPAAWDLRVLNNTNGNALYVLDSSVFNTGAADMTRNLTATTGWGGAFAGNYTGVRAAAPFAVLDTLYSATQFVIAQGDSALQLPPLKAFWSVNNRPTAGNPAIGNIDTTSYGTASFPGAEVGIYILGAENIDTDEFDQHVLAHEYQHFLEDAISRTDSIGRDHALGERLDMRLAFSEGFANAYSAMVLDDPRYRDSFGTAQGADFNFNIETDVFSVPGWYSEASIHRIVWDLYDTTNDAADSDGVTIGYGPMFDVFRAELRNDTPLTSLFAFISALKQQPSMPVAAIDVRVEAEGVPGTSFGIDSQNIDAYATTETHSSVAPVSADLVLPIYSEIALNGPPVRLCGDAEVTAPGGDVVPGTYNKLGNRRFLKFSVPSARIIDVQVTCRVTDPTCVGSPQPDPDLVLSQGPSLQFSDSTDAFTERLQTPVQAGEHVLEIYEYSHIDTETTSRRGRTCMTVTITG